MPNKAAWPALVCRAIREWRLVRLVYKDALRMVEPHLFGFAASEEPMFSGWQVSGRSGVGWRNFHFSGVSGLALTDETFSEPRPDYNPDDPSFARITCRLPK
jgi:hypothetical protein